MPLIKKNKTKNNKIKNNKTKGKKTKGRKTKRGKKNIVQKGGQATVDWPFKLDNIDDYFLDNRNNQTIDIIHKDPYHKWDKNDKETAHFTMYKSHCVPQSVDYNKDYENQQHNSIIERIGNNFTKHQNSKHEYCEIDDSVVHTLGYIFKVPVLSSDSELTKPSNIDSNLLSHLPISFLEFSKINNLFNSSTFIWNRRNRISPEKLYMPIKSILTAEEEGVKGENIGSVTTWEPVKHWQTIQEGDNIDIYRSKKNDSQPVFVYMYSENGLSWEKTIEGKRIKKILVVYRDHITHDKKQRRKNRESINEIIVLGREVGFKIDVVFVHTAIKQTTADEENDICEKAAEAAEAEAEEGRRRKKPKKSPLSGGVRDWNKNYERGMGRDRNHKNSHTTRRNQKNKDQINILMSLREFKDINTKKEELGTNNYDVIIDGLNFMNGISGFYEVKHYLLHKLLQIFPNLLQNFPNSYNTNNWYNEENQKIIDNRIELNKREIDEKQLEINNINSINQELNLISQWFEHYNYQALNDDDFQKYYHYYDLDNFQRQYGEFNNENYNYYKKQSLNLNRLIILNDVNREFENWIENWRPGLDISDVVKDWYNDNKISYDKYTKSNILGIRRLVGGKTKKTKKTRKHKGIHQTGGNKGRLKKGYKYSGKRLKSGLPEIVKCKSKKCNKN